MAEPTVPDDWAWKPIDVDCDQCGATNRLHEQPPELLAAGVAWECNACGGKNRLGGSDPVDDALYVLECGHCHATFDPNTVDETRAFNWTCPVCGTKNKDVTAAEQATSTEVASA